MYLTLSGIYGIPLKVMFDYIVLFVVFGAFLEVTGGITLFMNLANALGGRQVGVAATAAGITSL